MGKKIYKLLSILLIIFITINQVSIVTTMAESSTETINSFLDIEINRNEVAPGEQFYLRVTGNPDQLDEMTIEKSDDLIEGEIKEVSNRERLYVYHSEHSGRYDLTARVAGLRSNTVSIVIKDLENRLSTFSNDMNISETTETYKFKTEEKMNIYNSDIGISATHPSLMSRNTQTLTGYVQGGAGDILEVNGELVVRVPRASIGSIASISVTAADNSPLMPLAFYQEGIDVVFPFTFDYEGLEEAAHFYTFSIMFEVATFHSHGVEPDNPYNVSLSYAGRTVDTEFSILPITLSKPIFSKLYYGSRENDGQGSFGNLQIDGQEVTNNNKFILTINYDGSQKDGVVVTDVLPKGTTLAPNPSTWNATGGTNTISGGVRIAEVINPGEAGNSFNYVTEEFVNKVSFNRDTNTLVVDFGNLSEDQAYIIEYALEVTDVDLFNEGRQEDGFSRNQASMTYNNQIINQTYRLRIPESNLPAISLRKSVDKNVINLNENELIYTLHVSKFSGTINQLVIEDELEEGMYFVEFLSDIPSYIDTDVNNKNIRFSANKEITGPLNFTLSFKVNVENYIVGDQITNFATLVSEEGRLNTSIVNTKKIDGRIKVIKTDDSSRRLEGARFAILNSEGEVIQTGTTGKNGTFLSEPLPIGKYQIHEIKAPEGYQVDTSSRDVFINENSIEKTTLTIENILVTGGVILTKIDSESGEVLKGAVFELQDQAGETLQTELITGSDGKIKLEGLAPGEYQLVETQSPTGYEKDSTPIKFTIEREKKTAVELKKENQLIPGVVVLTKVDAQNEKPLQGAVFELQDQAGETLQTELITGSDGKIKLERLGPGEYQLVETQAPVGYELDKTPRLFEIDKEKVTSVTLTKKNSKLVNSELNEDSMNKNLPKTGEVFVRQVLFIALGSLLVLISLRYIKKNTKFFG
ncbi:MSCRAMM family protein [Enterococcus raffinosus]|uniref:SpaA isopeptide-forming pilin-related protein n=1 Tax=Enterococcus raffinosus TaxID=71452 RepID=A0AAW8TFJ3_9ENTE|nr:SpaA isopeptide-forming pilin-related protein [Enterococcus raffinosus]MDT2521724.1 SpaA isopeptide-forming pilin-related protein [Enterococcus raffinosus]MDT2532079.1 SpaA isopeptide-forming pilin-related protein [Enterococcus raffinosus]MDT2532761.1 SpaA isopeptide-forming pilin-related protein [Enterococcus raffinosus]MDT2545520.1 SpaA isopeptide-forming pilin-related protein [Enterococcus raffinosus]MDT2554662.1 SpaA isopeptide-forming pilin-related protein [Enterococcus raffinosus]